MATNNAVNLKSAGVVGYDGAGAFVANAVTQYCVQIGGATSSALVSVSNGNTGQFLGANTGAAPTWQTPAGGGLSWSVITADQSITVANGYICNKAGLLTLTLPASASIGDTFEVTGINTDLGWKIGQNANQQIFYGNQSTTVGTGGSLASTLKRDSVRVVCVVSGSSTVYNVVSSVGNITVV